MGYQQFNYENYLEQNKLREAHRFQPVFEAVENAFNAIEERAQQDALFNGGLVRIEIHRAEEPILPIAKNAINPSEIVGFSVFDDGIGFQDANWAAYQTVYTSHKKSKGGKGVGRLSYLQAFGDADVRSIYNGSDGILYERSFKLVRSEGGTIGESNTAIKQGERMTVIHLNNFEQRLRRQAPKAFEAIVAQLTEHFFKRLSVDSSIKCVVQDDWDGRKVDLKEFCERELILDKKEERINVGGHELRVTHAKCKTRVTDKHQLHLCANGRVVASFDIPLKHIPTKRKLQRGDVGYFYLAFVEGSLLDQEATQDRLGFNLEFDVEERLEGIEDVAGPLPAITQIIGAVGSCARVYLKSDLDPLEVQHKKRIEEFCREHVMYRPLLAQRMEQLTLIPLNLPDSELEVAIWRIYHDWKADVRKRFDQMARTVRENTDDLQKYRGGYRDALRDLNQMAMHELAAYVTDRRAVIDFLWDRLKASDTGKFQDEDAVHDIFFPRKKTSLDIAWDESNLWLIDERLAFQQFTASDIPLARQFPSSKSQQRPDIGVLYDRVFDETFAFSDGESPFTSLTLIEFKKPERSTYDEKENPVAQAVRYIKDIRANKVLTYSGHTFRITDATPIHVHVICHIVDELKDELASFNPFPTPDGEGLIIYLNHYKAYIQVTSFEKLIADARKRNEVFFRKLGIDRPDWHSPQKSDEEELSCEEQQLTN